MEISEQRALLRSSPQAVEYGLQRHVTVARNKGARVRTWLATKLDAPAFHKAIITLIAIDATCVLADLIYTFLSKGCTPTEESPPWLEVLLHISLAITTIFLLEIPLALWAFGPRYYRPLGAVPHASLHLFDAAIVLTTFVLEIVLRGRERELAGLLVLLRLWRLVKLVGGLAVGAGELTEELEKQLADAEKRLVEQTSLVEQLEQENRYLKAQSPELNAARRSTLNSM